MLAFSDLHEIIMALLSSDPLEMQSAFQKDAFWVFGLIFTLLGSYLALLMYRYIPFVEKHLERSVMVWSYLLIAVIIFVEVFRRFILGVQAPWSTTIPPYLFLIMTWYGCSYNVRLRTHLSFNELRSNLSSFGQLLCSGLETLLWVGLSWVVVVTTVRSTTNSAANFQILLGTDNVLQWWFLITVPIAFILMSTRAIENFFEDLAKYKIGDPVYTQAVIGEKKEAVNA